MGTIIAIVFIIVVVIAVLIGLLFSSSRRSARKAATQAHESAAASGKQSLTSAQSKKLAEARRTLSAGSQLALRVQDKEIALAAKRVLKQAEDIIATMRNQPDEIRRASQFFGYYLPTINSVLAKYIELEGSGTDIAKQTETVKSYLSNVSSAFDEQYKNMFRDEQMNLEVAAEAMQMALKRDGLL